MLPGALGNTWATAEQEDAIAVARVLKIVWDEICPIEVLRKGLPEKHETRDIHANSVIEDDRFPQNGPNVLIPRRDIQ